MRLIYECIRLILSLRMYEGIVLLIMTGVFISNAIQGYARKLRPSEYRKFEHMTLYRFTHSSAIIDELRVDLRPSKELYKHISSGYRKALFFFDHEPIYADLREQDITSADILVKVKFSDLNPQFIRYRPRDSVILYLGRYVGEASWITPEYRVLGTFNKGFWYKTKAWIKFIARLIVGLFAMLYTLILAVYVKHIVVWGVVWCFVIGLPVLYWLPGGLSYAAHKIQKMVQPKNI